MLRFGLVFVFVCLSGFWSAGLAAAPKLNAQLLSTAPVLDGRVSDDPAWLQAEPASGFTQVRPHAGAPATQRTQVYVGYTRDALYIAAILHDDHPQGVLVTDSRRDSSLDDTDSFQVILDSFHDRQNGFVFGTNPAGVEYDGQVTKEGAGDFGSGAGGFNLNWDTSWRVQTQVGAFGWSLEMEIPFRSLRYPGGAQQTWGINFQRNIRRNNEVAYWAPLDHNFTLFRVSDAGSLEALEVPPQRNLKLTPYVLGRAARGGDLRGGAHFDEEVGFDLKYSLTPSLTLDATYNTDFAQVEVDEQQVNLNRFSLFFPEKRPFFLENAGQFSVGNPQEIELFFSRRIGVGAVGDPLGIDGGLRLTGKVGAATNVGALYMRSEAVDGVAPQNDFAVLRVNQEFANRSSLGAMYVGREGDGSFLTPESDDYNRTYAIDGRWGVGQYATVQGFAARTDTPGLDDDDHAFSLGTSYSSQVWAHSASYTEVGENFNPEVGFLSRDGYRKLSVFGLRRIRPADWLGIHELRPHIAYRGYWDFDGFQETGFLHVDNHWEWKNGYEVHTGVNFTREGVKTPFEINDGTFVLPGTYDHAEADLVFISDQSAPLSVSVESAIGGFFGGDRINIDPAVRYRFGETFSAEVSWSYNDIDLPVENGRFKVNLGRLRLSYSFTPKVLLQALVQYNDRTDVVATNLRFSWLQSANTGLFLVYNEIDDRSITGPGRPRRELVLKFSHIFDLL